MFCRVVSAFAVYAVTTVLWAASAHAQLAVLETNFGPGHMFSGDFGVDWSIRPSAAATKQFFINSGLDAVMSNGQKISDVATNAPSDWNPPYYNPLLYHASSSGGTANFAPATSPLSINTAALTAAVMANAASLDVIRIEVFKKVGSQVTTVVIGEKANFDFVAVNFGSGISFVLRWTNVGFQAPSWFDPNAQYAFRITAGMQPNSGACCVNGGCVILSEKDCVSIKGEFQGNGTSCSTVECSAACNADLNGNGVVDVQDLLILLSSWGPCLR